MSEYREPEPLGGEFGFRVGLSGEQALSWEADEETTTTWTVELPHQCDAWTIAEEDTREEAIARMELFLSEGQKALERLREIDA